MAIHRHLFGPGPSNPYPEVMEGLAQPILGHLDPLFLDLMDETCDMLRVCWGTDNLRTLPLSATGSAGMEAAFVNTVHPGDVVVVGINGLFGERMAEVARRCGGEVITVEHEYGQPVDVERMVAAHPGPAMYAMVHAETSTGVVSDVAAMGQAKGDALLLVDAVTSIGGWELAIDDWGVDVAYAGSQKCLGIPPGLAPFTINERAWNRRVTTPHSWYLDLGLLGGYVGEATGGGRTYHHTAPTGMVVGMHAGLTTLLEEGIPAAAKRHREAGEHLQNRVVEHGWELFAADGHRLPMLTSVVVPDGVDSAAVRGWLLENKNIEIGAGTGAYATKIWRIGLMGPNATVERADYLFNALVEAVEKA